MKRHFLVVAVPLFCFWIALGTEFNWERFFLGIAITVGVTLFSYSVIAKWLVPMRWHPQIPWRLFLYILERLRNIIHANIDLAERLLDPKLPINPAIVCLKHDLKNPVACAILANSITLTPGTLTVEIDKENIYIHFLAEEYLDNILSSKLNQKIRTALLLNEGNP